MDPPGPEINNYIYNKLDYYIAHQKNDDRV